jgi:hypothetical protein
MSNGQERREPCIKTLKDQRVQSQQRRIHGGPTKCEVENAAASEAKSQMATGLRDMSLSISTACDAPILLALVLGIRDSGRAKLLPGEYP